MCITENREIQFSKNTGIKRNFFCKNLCAKLGVEFFPLKIKKVSVSEAALRDQRYQALRQCLQDQQLDILALAHHRDDLLETRLLRLIRGTGGQGFAAMHTLEMPLFRPLLDFFKADLEAYLKSEKLRFLKDPSNDSLDPMRNWLREKWLKPLEKKQKGSLVSLARSLETLASEVSSSEKSDLLRQNAAFLSQDPKEVAKTDPKGIAAIDLSRSFYLSLNPTEQGRLLAQYLHSRGKKDFSQSHLQEIRKRLDKEQKDLTFRVAGCNWFVNAEQIKVVD